MHTHLIRQSQHVCQIALLRYNSLIWVCVQMHNNINRACSQILPSNFRAAWRLLKILPTLKSTRFPKLEFCLWSVRSCNYTLYCIWVVISDWSWSYLMINASACVLLAVLRGPSVCWASVVLPRSNSFRKPNDRNPQSAYEDSNFDHFASAYNKSRLANKNSSWWDIRMKLL